MAENYEFPDEQEENKKPSVAVTEDDGDVEIEIVDDTPEKDRGRKPLDKDVTDPTDDELENYSDGVKKRIKELTHARHDERRAKEAVLRERQELERIAQALVSENQKLKYQFATGAQQYAQTANSAAALMLENAKKKLKEAHEAFDTDAIVAAQEELADAKMQMRQVQSFRPPSLQEMETPVQVPQVAPQQPQIDDKTLRWQAKNQWFGAPGNEEMTSYSLGLHQKLVNSGVDPRSDEYFEQIDARIRATFPDYFGSETRSKGGSGKPSTVVAPSSRSTSPGKIRLTATQVALARKLGLTNQQYAMELAKLENSNG